MMYGNLAPSQIMATAAVSLLDPGVHAVGLVVQVYGVKEVVVAETEPNAEGENTDYPNNLMVLLQWTAFLHPFGPLPISINCPLVRDRIQSTGVTFGTFAGPILLCQWRF
jgi:hypothetical protein